MNQEMPVQIPISAQLASLREIQASGQLLVAIGGFIAFLSLKRQIPLMAQQASIVQSLQSRITQLERRSGKCDSASMIY